METTVPVRDLVPIPSTYRNIEFKSRMEAQFACLLDHMGLQWTYEPFSLVLPDGVAYTPDFLITYGLKKQSIVETRGYRSSHGDAQISSMARFYGVLGFLEFVAIGPSDCRIWDGLGQTDGSRVAVMRCSVCELTQFRSNKNIHCIFGCDSTFSAIPLGLLAGKITVRGFNPGEWPRDATFRYFSSGYLYSLDLNSSHADQTR